MKTLVPLMQREWLQHRFGWALMALIPVGLALVLTIFGQVQIDGDSAQRVGDALPMILAVVSIVGGAGLLFVIASFGSWIMVAGLARRDHGDRSIEFWLSLPVGHSASLGVPLLVHLLLAPAAALLVGLASGYLVSLVLVTRVVGLGAWFALPWGAILAGTLAAAARLLAGLPLAVLWLSPLILAVVLATAWFRRWAWVVLGVGVGLISLALQRTVGDPVLIPIIKSLLAHAAAAMVSADEASFTMAGSGQAFEALHELPAWALSDFGMALGDLASPLFVGGLLFAGACFALLVQWRQRGASAAA